MYQLFRENTRRNYMRIFRIVATIILLILLIPFAILGLPAFLIILMLNWINSYNPNVVGLPKQDN
jgi:ABC-type glycerol-3-phosphate transport system permease component